MTHSHFGRNACCCDKLIDALSDIELEVFQQFEGLNLIPLCDIDSGDIVGYMSVIRTENTDPPTTSTLYFDTTGQPLGAQPTNSQLCPDIECLQAVNMFCYEDMSQDVAANDWIATGTAQDPYTSTQVLSTAESLTFTLSNGVDASATIGIGDNLTLSAGGAGLGDFDLDWDVPLVGPLSLRFGDGIALNLLDTFNFIPAPDSVVPAFGTSTGPIIVTWNDITGISHIDMTFDKTANPSPGSQAQFRIDEAVPITSAAATTGIIRVALLADSCQNPPVFTYHNVETGLEITDQDIIDGLRESCGVPHTWTETLCDVEEPTELDPSNLFMASGPGEQLVHNYISDPIVGGDVADEPTMDTAPWNPGPIAVSEDGTQVFAFQQTGSGGASRHSPGTVADEVKTFDRVTKALLNTQNTINNGMAQDDVIGVTWDRASGRYLAGSQGVGSTRTTLFLNEYDPVAATFTPIWSSPSSWISTNGEYGFAVATDGRIFCPVNGLSGDIGEFNPTTGALVGTFSTGASRPQTNVTGLAWDHDNNQLLVQRGAEVYIINNAGTYTVTVTRGAGLTTEAYGMDYSPALQSAIGDIEVKFKRVFFKDALGNVTWQDHDYITGQDYVVQGQEQECAQPVLQTVVTWDKDLCDRIDTVLALDLYSFNSDTEEVSRINAITSAVLDSHSPAGVNWTNSTVYDPVGGFYYLFDTLANEWHRYDATDLAAGNTNLGAFAGDAITGNMTFGAFDPTTGFGYVGNGAINRYRLDFNTLTALSLPAITGTLGGSTNTSSLSITEGGLHYVTSYISPSIQTDFYSLDPLTGVATHLNSEVGQQINGSDFDQDTLSGWYGIDANQGLLYRWTEPNGSDIISIGTAPSPPGGTLGVGQAEISTRRVEFQRVYHKDEFDVITTQDHDYDGDPYQVQGIEEPCPVELEVPFSWTKILCDQPGETVISTELDFEYAGNVAYNPTFQVALFSGGDLPPDGILTSNIVPVTSGVDYTYSFDISGTGGCPNPPGYGELLVEVLDNDGVGPVLATNIYRYDPPGDPNSYVGLGPFVLAFIPVGTGVVVRVTDVTVDTLSCDIGFGPLDSTVITQVVPPSAKFQRVYHKDIVTDVTTHQDLDFEGDAYVVRGVPEPCPISLDAPVLEVGCITDPAAFDFSNVERCLVGEVRVDGVSYQVRIEPNWSVSDFVDAVNTAAGSTILAFSDGVVVSALGKASTFVEISCLTEDFEETFGAGTPGLFSAIVPPATTSYNFDVTGFLNAGDYAIARVQDGRPSVFDMGLGAAGVDATGDPNGNVLMVNGDPTPGEFYKQPISSLIVGQEYTFRAFIANGNATDVPSQRPDVTMEIRDSVTAAVLGTVDTGPIDYVQTWREFSINFTYQTTNDIEIVLINNSGAAGGNDVLFDQVTFARVERVLLPFTNRGEATPVEIIKQLDSDGGIASFRIFLTDGVTELDYQTDVLDLNKVFSLGPCPDISQSEPCSIPAGEKVCYEIVNGPDIFNWASWTGQTTAQMQAFGSPVNITVNPAPGVQPLNNGLAGHTAWDRWATEGYSVAANTYTTAWNALTTTFNFDVPVLNPVFAVNSLGAIVGANIVTLITSEPYSILNAWASGGGGTINVIEGGTVIVGMEGHALVYFPGIHSSISFTADVTEATTRIVVGNWELDTVTEIFEAFASFDCGGNPTYRDALTNAVLAAPTLVECTPVSWSEILCDDDCISFNRTYHKTLLGAVTFQDHGLDGISYTPVGQVDVCGPCGCTTKSILVDLDTGATWTTLLIPANHVVTGLTLNVITQAADSSITDADATVVTNITAGLSMSWNANQDYNELAPPQAIFAGTGGRMLLNMTLRDDTP